MNLEFISPVYSMDGKILAVVHFDEDFDNTFIATCNLSTKCTQLHHVTEGRIICPIWTHGEFLQFATVESGYITIWEVEFTLKQPPKVVKSLPIPENISDEYDETDFLFLLTRSRLAIALEDTLLIWDAQDFKILL